MHSSLALDILNHFKETVQNQSKRRVRKQLQEETCSKVYCAETISEKKNTRRVLYQLHEAYLYYIKNVEKKRTDGITIIVGTLYIKGSKYKSKHPSDRISEVSIFFCLSTTTACKFRSAKTKMLTFNVRKRKHMHDKHE